VPAPLSLVKVADALFLRGRYQGNYPTGRQTVMAPACHATPRHPALCQHQRTRSRNRSGSILPSSSAFLPSLFYPCPHNFGPLLGRELGPKRLRRMTQHFRTLFRRDLGPSSPAGIVVHLSRNIAARSPVRKRWTMGSLAKEVSQCLKLNTYRPGVALSCTEGGGRTRTGRACGPVPS
jgi:hypothetical protein